MTKFVLSLSGGGIRGAFTLGILENIELFLQREFNESIYSKFDYFAGSSTGALIACSFSHEQLYCNDIFDRFYNEKTAYITMNQSIADKIFGLVQCRPKYDGIGKRDVIKSITKNRHFNETNKCVLVPIYDVKNNSPIFAKSYSDEKDLSLLDVLDATTAAPGYFPSVCYDPENTDNIGVDGCLVTLNPALDIYLDAKKHNPDTKIVVLSIGTGKRNPCNTSSTWGGIEWATKGDLIDLILDGPAENSVLLTKNVIEANGDTFLHIDTILPEINKMMDNVSQDNIDTLRQHGRSVWEKHQQKIKDLFPENLQMFDEYRPETPINDEYDSDDDMYFENNSNEDMYL